MIITIIVKLMPHFFARSEWSAEIEMDENTDLIDLHYIIQDAVGFDDDHLYEFYVAASVSSITKIHFDDDSGEDLETPLSEIFPLPKKRKLFYLFDYGDSWRFQISRSRKKARPAIDGIEYPRLVAENGKKPEQYPDYDDY